MIAEGDGRRPKQVRGEPFVARELGSTTRRAFEAEAKAKGVPPRTIIEIGSREAIREAEFFADPPEVAAPHARVLWDPDLCSTVCRARAERDDEEGIDLLSLASRSIVLRTPDRTQHILIENSDRTIQLAVVGADIGHPARIMTAIPVRAQQVAAHLWMAKCLNELCTKGRLPSGHLPVRPRRQRLRMVLQALDAFLAGACHREISSALFGEKRTNAD